MWAQALSDIHPSFARPGCCNCQMSRSITICHCLVAIRRGALASCQAVHFSICLAASLCERTHRCVGS